MYTADESTNESGPSQPQSPYGRSSPRCYRLFRLCIWQLTLTACDLDSVLYCGRTLLRAYLICIRLSFAILTNKCNAIIQLSTVS